MGDNILIGSACLLGFAAVAVVCAPSDREAAEGTHVPEAHDPGRLPTEVLPANHVEDGTVAVRGPDSIQLIKGARNVVVKDSEPVPPTTYGGGSAHPRARDLTVGQANAIHPRVLVDSGPPAQAQWYGGDIILNGYPDPSASRGWWCASTGIPGVWLPIH